MKKIFIGADKWLKLKDIEAVARKSSLVSVEPDVYKIVAKNRAVLENFLKKRIPIYGITTQFGGDLHRVEKNIGRETKTFLNSLKERQNNLIQSHNCGLGEETPADIVRSAMLLRAQMLSKGMSGVRPIVIKSLVDFLNKNIVPVVRRYGSIGASGDLIPLAAIASALTGSGLCFLDGKKIEAKISMKKFGLKPLQLEAKEGLGLINGTSFMTAIAALTVSDIAKLFPVLLSALAVALESLSVITDAYDPFVHKAKKHSGQIIVDEFFVNFWQGSKLLNKKDLQDYYSLRSIPQGFGPFYENIKQAINWIEEEMNSVNDNPIVRTNPAKIYNNANFMGYYITEACDILKIDIAQASSWIHAIIANLIHPRKNKGLPANLIENPDEYSGFKPIQVLAASLAVQNRKLSLSNQAVMLPTEGDNQDVNSLGTHAAFDLKESYENLEKLTAILLLAGMQAIELRGIKKASKESKKIYQKIRKVVPFLHKDKPLSADIEKIISLIKSGNLTKSMFF
ncbi:MAG: aromatic amino acid ammonia-lyase [bacterium]|nr:aromatic amino acid ammonia-lyase [bacterium]